MMVKRKRVGGCELEALGDIADRSNRRQVSSQVYITCQNGSAFETPHSQGVFGRQQDLQHKLKSVPYSGHWMDASLWPQGTSSS